MKAIVIRQPWATLVSLGVKSIETRPSPPNGPMRPEGVRGLPGCTLERGERIAIVAGAGMAGWGRPSTWRARNERQFGPYEVENDGGGLMLRGDSLLWPYRLPLGAVVCTATVDDALPIAVVLPKKDRAPGTRAFPEGDAITVHPLSSGRDLHVIRGGNGLLRSDQLPLGDFTPGRWGWLLGGVQPTAPVPCKGRQGVFVLPGDVAEQVS